MAVAHSGKPFWGLQFHPESICTTSHCAETLILNWWAEACKWKQQFNFSHSKGVSLPDPSYQSGLPWKKRKRTSFLRRFHFDTARTDEAPSKTPSVDSGKAALAYGNHCDGFEAQVSDEIKTPTASTSVEVQHVCISWQSKTPVDRLYECLREMKTSSQILLLESGTTQSGELANVETGNCSIFAIVEPCKDESLLYFVNGNRLIHVNKPMLTQSSQGKRQDKNSETRIQKNVADVWDYVKDFMIHHKAVNGPTESPFWGGLVGFASYESCLETINVKPALTLSERPDIHLVFAKRSVVLDHVGNKLYIQSIAAGGSDDVWLRETKSRLQGVSLSHSKSKFPPVQCSNFAPKARESDAAENSTFSKPVMKPREHSPFRCKNVSGAHPSEEQLHQNPPSSRSLNPKVYTAKAPLANPGVIQVISPQKQTYASKIESCQSSIRVGDSYELCLTDRTTVLLSRPLPAWPLYRRLRTTNPAPFSAYFHFPCISLPQSARTANLENKHGLKGSSCFAKSPQSLRQKTDSLTILCTSPERFLSWSRSGTLQFRPIKGTVAKFPAQSSNLSSSKDSEAFINDCSPCYGNFKKPVKKPKNSSVALSATTAIASSSFSSSVEPMTLAQATKILSTPKEQAENLMILDLIRHDLHGALDCTASRVRVAKLMAVEEYERVFQLVSVIEGDLDPDQNGLDVLKASLPPGSMTGAPKKRSCEILRDVEECDRGIYSGILGYLDVGGGGDWSVVIRTAWSWGGADQARHQSDGDNGPWHPHRQMADDGRANEHDLNVSNSRVSEEAGHHKRKADSTLTQASQRQNATNSVIGERNVIQPQIIQLDDTQRNSTTSCINEIGREWHIGAGGAITSQSTMQGEWEEMLTKRAALLGIFVETADEGHDKCRD